MKKFAAIFVSVMLVALLAIAPVVSAATPAKDFAKAVEDRVTARGSSNGSLTLNKYQLGSDKKVPVAGATFTAYRVYDLKADTGLFDVSTNFKAVTKLSEYLKDGSLTYNSTADLEGLIPTLQKTAGKLNADNKSVFNSNETKSDGKGTGVYKFESLPLGVYLVIETVVPASYAVSSVPFLVSIPEWDEEKSTWNFDITANPKDDKITIDKVITNSDDAKGDVKSATKDIGDKVAYKVSTNIPSYTGTLTDAQKKDIKFTFVDTMSEGLTYNTDLVVQLANQDKVFVKDTDYTIDVKKNAEKKTTTITVAFVWTSLNDYQGEEIVFTYSATLNEKAAIGTANENAAKLQYTNDPRANNSDPDGDGEPKPGDPVETPESKTKVYTYEMNLTKTFNGAAANGTDINASGVEFTLTVKGGAQLQFVKLGDGVYTVYGDNFGSGDTQLAASATPVSKISPSATGSLVVKGLDDVTYVLSEVSSINGWSKLAGDVEITLTGNKSGDTEEYDGKLKSATATPDVKLTVNKRGTVDASGVFGITINNVKNQFNLPLTGGAGLLMFTIGGGIIIAGAIIIFSSLRKERTAK